MAIKQEYDECKEKGQLIETGVPDKNMAKELLNLTQHRQNFWEEVEKNYAKKYPSLFLEGHYEIIKELLTAILILDGWKATNHECLFAYIKENYKDKLEMDTEFLLELKDLRNNIDYRGVMVSFEKWNNTKLRIKTEIKELRRYVTERIKEE